MNKIKRLNVVFYYFLSMFILGLYIFVILLQIENYTEWKQTALQISLAISVIMFICGLFALPSAIKNLKRFK